LAFFLPTLRANPEKTDNTSFSVVTSDDPYNSVRPYSTFLTADIFEINSSIFLILSVAAGLLYATASKPNSPEAI